LRGFCTSCASARDSLDITAMDILSKEVENLTNFFINATGCRPWSLQRYWIKRLVLGESFAMIAPTGVGKSTLLAVYALYRAYYYRSKVYVLTPTREIAKQMYKRLSEFIDKLGIKGLRVVFYDSSSKDANHLKASIKNHDFDILITSAAFLTRHQELLEDKRFDIVIADDLDSIMKSSKSIDKILTLLGFNNEEVELALKIVKLRQALIVAKVTRGEDAIEKIKRELLELEALLRNSIAKKSAQLVVASATGRSRGLKTQVLKLLLGFDAGAVFEYWRNIVDVYQQLDESFYSTIIHIAKKLKSGIVFVSSLYKSFIPELIDKLRREGLRVEIAKSGSKAVDKFRRGDVDILVGSTSYYGILVRGLDEPLRTRFTIFVGVPSVVRDLSDSLDNPRFLFMVLRELWLRGHDVEDLLREVANIITSSTPSMLFLYSKLMKQRQPSSPVSQDVLNKVKQLTEIKTRTYEIAKRVLDSSKILVVRKSCLLVKRGNRYLVIRPDPYTYIQASGRCSRLLRGIKTFGVSVIFDEYPELISILENVLKKYIHTFTVKKFDISDLDRYAYEVEKSRTSQGSGSNINIATALIIVESPTKAKTIANMFGKPAKRVLGNAIVYETMIPVTQAKTLVASIMSSLGHITDLVVDEGLHGVGISGTGYKPIYDFITRCRNCGSQHVGIYDSCPYCGSVEVLSSSSIYNVMKAIASQVDEVYVATDPDAEGEKIAFDIYSLLVPYNKYIYRIEFREVTKNAILAALRNPRNIDMKRVEAQIARRVADRWIGFDISMWLQLRFNKPWLGAGRVQSPVLLWVSSRYTEYKENLGYLVIADIGGYRIRLYVGKGAEAKEEANMLLEKILKEGLEVARLEFVEKEVPPPPPFTTDSLIQEANIMFGFTASKTMVLAQALFELGLITYHRTDTTRVSALGISIAQEALKRANLESLFTPRTWGGDGKEGAHEAIRPTNPVNADELVEMVIRGDIGLLTRIGNDHVKLYDLIYRRFIASQMPSAKIRYLRIEVKAGDRNIGIVEVPIEVLDPGFTRLYPVKLYTNILKNLDIETRRIKVEKAIVARGSTTSLYRVADIIKMMKDKGIGRPSTYAKAIDNNVKHGYVVMSKQRKFLIPTKLGLEVAEVINKNFLDLVGENVTKELEELLDNIEMGKVDVREVLDIIRDRVDKTVRMAEVTEVLHAVSSEATTITT